MHLYVNSNQSHSQSSMGSFVSASFVSQLESVHDRRFLGNGYIWKAYANILSAI